MTYTISQYAEKMKVTSKTVRVWIREGKLDYEFTPSNRKLITGIKK
jgi:excisionase family DNA binding protein